MSEQNHASVLCCVCMDVWYDGMDVGYGWSCMQVVPTHSDAVIGQVSAPQD